MGLLVRNLCVIAALSFPCAGAQKSSVIVEKQILPLLEERCAKCHAGSEPAAKLDVRTRAALVKGGVTGPAIVPGSAEKSLLYQRVKAGEMPLGGPPLPAAEVEKIRDWIERGAPAMDADTLAAAPPGISPRDREHWAFQTPGRPRVPKTRSSAGVRTPIDAFLLATLERNKLSFSPQADRVILMRRAYFDLIGLPPTPQEVDEFLADTSADSYELRRALGEALARCRRLCRLGRRRGRRCGTS